MGKGNEPLLEFVAVAIFSKNATTVGDEFSDK